MNPEEKPPSFKVFGDGRSRLYAHGVDRFSNPGSIIPVACFAAFFDFLLKFKYIFHEKKSGEGVNADYFKLIAVSPCISDDTINRVVD